MLSASAQLARPRPGFDRLAGTAGPPRRGPVRLRCFDAAEWRADAGVSEQQRISALSDEVGTLTDRLKVLDPRDQLYKSLKHEQQRRDAAEATAFLTAVRRRQPWPSLEPPQRPCGG